LNEGEGQINTLLASQIAPNALVLTNYIIIPSGIDFISHYLGFKYKSDRHKSNFFKHFFFLLFCTLVIPLFGLTSFDSLFTYVHETEFEKVAVGTMYTSEFFIRFLLSLSFFSTAYYIVDGPHWIYKMLLACQFKRKSEWFTLHPSRYEDDWFWDVGWFFAFSMVVFAIGTFFTTLAPIVPAICFFFFCFKYWVDKYNFIYVYSKEYDCVQPFGQWAGYICTAIVFGSKVFMFYIIRSNFGPDFVVPANVFLGFEVIMLLTNVIIDIEIRWRCCRK